MRELLMLTPVLDAADPVQGFAIGWVNALAARVPRLTAAALRVGDVSGLAGTVVPIGLGRPDASRGLVAARIARLATRAQADACLVHMNWPMLLAAGPVLRARKIRTGLWWAHGAVPPGLRLAQGFADVLLTSSRAACRIGGPRRRVLGQGIDVDRFTPAAAEPPAPFTVLTAGRIAPVKRIGQVAAACGQAGVRLRIVGPGQLPGIISEPPVAHAAMPALLRGAHVFATASATGSPDKAALEAMACGLPVVALGEGLRDALPADLAAEVIVPDSAAMAARLATLAAMQPADRRALGARLRAAIVARHALDALAARIIAAIDAC
jgi:glycosyltransferase involved in cell wall biosynthesis